MRKILAVGLLFLCGCNYEREECQKPKQTYTVNYSQRVETTCKDEQCKRKEEVDLHPVKSKSR